VTKVLIGYDVEGIPSTGSKELRANTFASQCKIGNIGLVRAWWNNGYLNFLCAFPDEAVHDDPVDASSGAFNCLYIAMQKDAHEHVAEIKRRVELMQKRAVQAVQGQEITGSEKKKWWDI